MKKIFLIGLMALVATGFSSCSSDDDAPAVEPSFEYLTGEYDTTELDACDFIVTTLDIVANAQWQVYSDKQWVLFSQEEDGEFVYDIVGTAGNHSVYMKITNDARAFDASEATVTARCGGKEFFVCTVSRAAKEYVAQITDEDGNVIDAINIDGSASTVITISGNTHYGIKSYPEWISEPVLYDGGYILSVKEEKTPYACEGEFVIGNADGTAEHKYEIRYEGLKPSYVEIGGDYNPWNWEVSLDGKTFRQESINSLSETEVILLEDAVPFTFTCLNYDCKFVFASVGTDGSISVVEGEDAWLRVTQSESDKSAVSVSATAFETTATVRQRSGWVFAVPAGIDEDFSNAINAASNASDFVEVYYQYVLIGVTQKDLYASNGFTVTTADGEPVECIDEPEGDFYDWVSSENSITEVCSMSGEYGLTYIINTHYTDDDFSGTAECAIYDSKGYANKRIWSLTFKKNDDGYYIIKLTVPVEEKFPVPVILRLHSQNVNKKALIIRAADN